jgi:hypothetical protein
VKDISSKEMRQQKKTRDKKEREKKKEQGGQENINARRHMREKKDAPVAAETDTPQRDKFSHTALPSMMPPASRMRVTTVASVLGVQSEKISVPIRQGTPLRATLS